MSNAEEEGPQCAVINLHSGQPLSNDCLVNQFKAANIAQVSATASAASAATAAGFTTTIASFTFANVLAEAVVYASTR